MTTLARYTVRVSIDVVVSFLEIDDALVHSVRETYRNRQDTDDLESDPQFYDLDASDAVRRERTVQSALLAHPEALLSVVRDRALASVDLAPTDDSVEAVEATILSPTDLVETLQANLSEVDYQSVYELAEEGPVTDTLLFLEAAIAVEQRNMRLDMLPNENETGTSSDNLHTL
jgi:hypothetical protein